MDDDLRLIERIYEASVVTDRWPKLLQDIADMAGARGTTIVSRSPSSFTMIASTGIKDVADEFIEQGWGAETDYTAPLFAEQWPGFRTEADYRTSEEIAALPVHRDFLDPRGYIAGAGTGIQGTRDHALHVGVDGFPSHQAAQHAVAFLDMLRPHLARSISLTALRSDHTQLVVDSLALAGAPAAIVGFDLRLRAANTLFETRMAAAMTETPSGVRFSDTFLMNQLSNAVERHRHARGAAHSILVRAEGAAPSFVMHLMPVTGTAREACGAEGVLMMISEPANASIPNADLLRLLFDLTPAEARLTRRIAEGETVEAAARAANIRTGTARAQLKSVFAKVGVRRQPELVRLLAGLGPPPSAA